MKGVILFVVMIAIVVVAIINNMPKSDTAYVNELDPYARVIDLQTNRIGKNFQTIVYFSDGYRYITRDHDDQPGFGVITRSVTSSVRKRIIMDAIESHNNACEKALNRKRKE